MSDHWEFYPCQMGENRAFIFYDHGIKDTLNSLRLPNAFSIRVEFDDPTEAGMPRDGEFARLSHLEDLIGTQLNDMEGIYVGRISVGGARYFHCFVPVTETVAKKVVQDMQRETGYSLQFVFEADPEKKFYWEELFPTAADWRVMQDMKVLDVLKQEGDNPSVARRVDHWLYFPHPLQRDRAAHWAAANAFTIESTSDPDDASIEFGLHIFHIARPELAEISSTTLLLQEKAEEFGGTYDGWETQVAKAESVSDILDGPANSA